MRPRRIPFTAVSARTATRSGSKDYTTRRIKTVFGTVKVRNPRWMMCSDCYLGMVTTFAPLKEICPDRAASELMELTARLGSVMSYRQAASVLKKFLPIEPTETHTTVRKRTIRVGELEASSLLLPDVVVVLVVVAMAAVAILSLPTRIELGIRFDGRGIAVTATLPCSRMGLKSSSACLVSCRNRRILSTDIAMRIWQPEDPSRPVPGHEPRG